MGTGRRGAVGAGAGDRGQGLEGDCQLGRGRVVCASGRAVRDGGADVDDTGPGPVGGEGDGPHRVGSGLDEPAAVDGASGQGEVTLGKVVATAAGGADGLAEGGHHGEGIPGTIVARRADLGECHGGCSGECTSCESEDEDGDREDRESGFRSGRGGRDVRARGMIF